MATKTKNPRTSGNPARRDAQLEEAALKREPRCQCRHSNGQCRRRATFRISAVCRADGCQSAVHVTLMCTTCKAQAMSYHDQTCESRHCLRVSSL